MSASSRSPAQPARWRDTRWRIAVLAVALLGGSFLATPGLAVSLPGPRTPSPSATAAVSVDDAAPLGAVNRSLFGTNYSTFNFERTVDSVSRLPWPSVAAKASTIGLHFVRMNPSVNLQYCGGVDCTYHWMTATPGAPGFNSNTHASILSPDEWMKHLVAVAGPDVVPLPLVNVEAGTVAEAQDWVAYMNGSASSLQLLSDGTTTGHWAQLRTANGHAAPYGIHYWEVGNEEYVLHPCLLGGQKNKSGCTNNTPLDCLLLSNQAEYGCLVNDYGAAMKAVDASIGIVAGYDGGDYSQVHAHAPSMIAALDLHQYPDANIEPFGTTFDTDAQRADYPVTFSTSGALQQVTYGLWLSAKATGHVDVYVDHAVATAGQFTVSPGTRATPFAITQTEVLAGTHDHTLTVVGCDTHSLNPLTHVCIVGGRHTQVYLQHITVTNASVSASKLAGAVGCFAGTQGLQSLNGGTPTQLVDTRVATTTGATGVGASAGIPWRLGAQTDFPVAYAAGGAQVFGPEVGGQWSKLWFWRMNMDSSGFTTTPLIIGEYAAWAGCIEEPTDLAVNQTSGIWTALISAIIYGDQSSTHPIIGASTYTFESGGPPVCDSWHIVTTRATTMNPCRGSDTAYESPVGLALGQFASLAGSRTKTTVVGGPNLLSFPAASQPLVGAPSVTAVSSTNGATVTVVLVNACTTQCGSGSVPAQINLTSGRSLTSATATTVSQAPLADNIDSAPNSVAQAPLAASVAGGTVNVTLPPFSVTTVTISTS